LNGTNAAWTGETNGIDIMLTVSTARTKLQEFDCGQFFIIVSFGELFVQGMDHVASHQT
jgi:hypothetical protein